MSDGDRLFEQVRRMLHETLDVHLLKVTTGTTQADLAEWDSMAQINLILAIEEAFDIRLNAKEASQLTSVRSILDLLHAKNVRS